jgi:DNA-binding NtrC family response regulator
MVDPATDRGSIRVLLVDDETTFRETLAKLLRRRGLDVATAASGEEGLARLVEHLPHVVVLDLKMPGLDGLATLSRINEMRPGTRVVMLTGHGSVEAGVEALRAAVWDFLLKPISPDQLVEVILAAAGSGAEPPDGIF